MATGPEPGTLSISGSIFDGLKILPRITTAQVATIRFAPTIGMATKGINKLGVDIRSFRVPLHDAIKNVIAPSIRSNFEAGGRPPWKDLSKATLATRAREGTGDKILVRSGKLQRVASQLNIWSITSTAAIIGNLPQEVGYGKVHQEGYDRRSAFIKKARGGAFGTTSDVISSALGKKSSPDIPARPFLMIHTEDEDAIRAVFVEWLGMRVAATMWR